MIQRLFLLSIYSLFTFLNINGQQRELQYDLSKWGLSTYSIDSNKVEKDIFYKHLQINDTAFRMFKKGKQKSITGLFGSYIGGALIGYSIADVMINKKKNYLPGAIGIGMIVISVPLSKSGESNINKAFDVYKTQPLPEQKNLEIEDNYKHLNESCFIVRYPVYHAKIKYLKNIISNKNTSNKSIEIIRQNLNEIIAENTSHLNVLKSGFTDFFDLKNIYFMPDSLYKPFLSGEKSVFVNSQGTIDSSLQCQSDNIYYFIQGKDKDQLLFVDKNLNKPSSPFPYKKRSFLPSFNKIFNKRKYIQQQIIYFNTKIMALVNSNNN